jgi:hypothetical protein
MSADIRGRLWMDQGCGLVFRMLAGDRPGQAATAVSIQMLVPQRVL